MKRPCDCGRVVITGGAAAPYREGRDCRRCFLFATNGEVNRAWGGDGGVIPVLYGPPPAPPPPPPPPCAHLGEPLTGYERNARSLDHSRQWRWCLNPAKPLGDAVCGCKGCGAACPGYDDGRPPAELVRNVVCHLLPVAGNGVWQRSVDQLRLRWPLFTGRKIFAVATGTVREQPLDTPETVRRYLPEDAEVVTVPNELARREVASWRPLWEALDSGPDSATLYCHTKGATRNVDPGNSCQWWGSLLWSLCLDHWELVARQLRRHPITGPFKKVGYGFGHDFGRWHYSGTFYWVRGDDFVRRWPRVPVPEKWWGVEAWPGLAYDVAEAGCLFLDGQVPQLDLYNPRFWTNTVRPEYARWLKLNPPSWSWAPSPSATG